MVRAAGPLLSRAAGRGGVRRPASGVVGGSRSGDSVVEQPSARVHHHHAVGVGRRRDRRVVHRAGRSHDVVGPGLSVHVNTPGLTECAHGSIVRYREFIRHHEQIPLFIYHYDNVWQKQARAQHVTEKKRVDSAKILPASVVQSTERDPAVYAYYYYEIALLAPGTRRPQFEPSNEPVGHEFGPSAEPGTWARHLFCRYNC